MAGIPQGQSQAKVCHRRVRQITSKVKAIQNKVRYIRYTDVGTDNLNPTRYCTTTRSKRSSRVDHPQWPSVSKALGRIKRITWFSRDVLTRQNKDLLLASCQFLTHSRVVVTMDDLYVVLAIQSPITLGEFSHTLY